MKRIIIAITVFAIALFAFPHNLVKADGNKEIEAGFTMAEAPLINVGNGMKNIDERVEFVAVEENEKGEYYLKFNVTAADSINSTFFHIYVKGEKGIKSFTVLDSNGDIYTGFYPDKSVISTFSIPNMGKNEIHVNNGQLAMGTYYIYIICVPRNVIEVNVTKEKDIGPNNRSLATSLTPGKVINAGIEDYWDEDWYKLQTGNTENFSFTFTNKDIDWIYGDGGFCSKFVITDSKENEMNFNDSNGDSRYEVQPLFLKKGKTKTYYAKLKKNSTYYIHIKGYGWPPSLEDKRTFKGLGKYSVKVDVAPSSVKLNKTSATLVKGKTLQLTATVNPSNVSNKTVTWKSSNTKVATVSSTGKVTAVGKGTATITVTTKVGNKKASSKITVTVTKEQGINDFVERCYTKVLGRKSEKNGKKYWVDRIMKAKNTKEEALKTASDGFFNSKEFLNKKTSNREFVKICYRTFLDREAEAGGLKYWLDLLDSKKLTKDQVLQGFATSTEFSNIMASYGIK